MGNPHSEDKTVMITVNGEQIEVPSCRTVGAALTLENGEAGWRTTRFGEVQRGLFCGIGVCFDCLATIDGQPGMRTCLVPVMQGMNVETGGAR